MFVVLGQVLSDCRSNSSNNPKSAIGHLPIPVIEKWLLENAGDTFRMLISNTSNRKINNILSIEFHATKRLPSSFNEKGVYAAFQCICKSCTRSQWLLRLETWSPSVDSLRSGIKNLKSFYYLHFKLQVIPTFLNSQTTRIVEKITKIYIIK